MALTAEDARELADDFFAASQGLDQFLDAQWNTISRPDYEAINEAGRTLLRMSSFMTTTAVGLSIDAMSDDAAELRLVVEEAKATLATLQDVQKAIRIAAGLADLATAIMAKNPIGALRATGNLHETLTG